MCRSGGDGVQRPPGAAAGPPRHRVHRAAAARRQDARLQLLLLLAARVNIPPAVTTISPPAAGCTCWRWCGRWRAAWPWWRGRGTSHSTPTPSTSPVWRLVRVIVFLVTSFYAVSGICLYFCRFSFFFPSKCDMTNKFTSITRFLYVLSVFIAD